MSAHARLAPSAAARWISCPGSVAAVQGMSEERPSVYAEEGTRAHGIFARCLLTGAAVADLLEDCAMVAPLQRAVDAARSIIGAAPVLIEQQLPPLPGLPDIWGTGDVVLFDAALRARGVIDLKYGVGVAVEAHAVQLAIYGVLAAHQFGVSPQGLTAWVVQPRCPHPQGPVRSHHYSSDDLVRMVEELGIAAAATGLSDAPRHAGAWCRFCPARPDCEELQRHPEAIPWLGGGGPVIQPLEPW
jgi:hypothetical protein